MEQKKLNTTLEMSLVSEEYRTKIKSKMSKTQRKVDVKHSQKCCHKSLPKSCYSNPCNPISGFD